MEVIDSNGKGYPDYDNIVICLEKGTVLYLASLKNVTKIKSTFVWQWNVYETMS